LRLPPSTKARGKLLPIPRTADFYSGEASRRAQTAGRN
jgi:hypothetical protein